MMEMESLVWGCCYCSVLMLHFSSQDLYIWRDLGSMAAIVGVYTPVVNIYLVISEIYGGIS
jgi:hypothetical protein